MDASSAAPTIASAARTELRRILLAAKLGAYPLEGGPASWTTYHWMMETVWIENVLSHQPARWLPAAYSSYDDLLAAAMDEALKKAPADLTSLNWGPEDTVTIHTPI